MTVKEKIVDVLKSNDLMCLSTVDENGMPKARSVDFAMGEDESVIYFMTMKATDKVNQLKNNNDVFIVIDKAGESMEDLSQLRYLKASGKAYISNTPEEDDKAFGTILATHT